MLQIYSGQLASILIMFFDIVLFSSFVLVYCNGEKNFDLISFINSVDFWFLPETYVSVAKRSLVKIFYQEYIVSRFKLQSIWLILSSAKTFVLHTFIEFKLFQCRDSVYMQRMLMLILPCYINVVYRYGRRLTQRTLFWCLTTRPLMRFSMKNNRFTFVIRYMGNTEYNLCPFVCRVSFLILYAVNIRTRMLSISDWYIWM